MKEIYWITRLDAISDLANLFIFIGALGTLVSIFCIIIGMNKDTSWDSYEIPRNIGKLSIKIFPALLALGILVKIFIPNTKEALVIYGVGGGLDYIKADSTAQRLPKKVIEACDAYLDELLKDE